MATPTVSFPQRLGQDWYRSLIAIAVYMLKQVGKCRHHRAAFTEGKVGCPDCGASLVRRWVVLRCAHCHRLRKPVYWFDSVIPGDRHCTHCSAQTFYEQAIESPLQPNHLPWAILTRQSEAEARSANHRSHFTRVWVEAQQENGLSPVLGHLPG